MKFFEHGVKFIELVVEGLWITEIINLAVMTQVSEPAVRLVTCFQFHRYYRLVEFRRSTRICTKVETQFYICLQNDERLDS